MWQVMKVYCKKREDEEMQQRVGDNENSLNY
jgi:hypothetical protein